MAPAPQTRTGEFTMAMVPPAATGPAADACPRRASSFSVRPAARGRARSPCPSCSSPCPFSLRPWAFEEHAGLLDADAPELQHDLVGLLVIAPEGAVAQDRTDARGRRRPHQVPVERALGLPRHRDVGEARPGEVLHPVRV